MPNCLLTAIAVAWFGVLFVLLGCEDCIFVLRMESGVIVKQRFSFSCSLFDGDFVKSVFRAKFIVTCISVKDVAGNHFFFFGGGGGGRTVLPHETWFHLWAGMQAGWIFICLFVCFARCSMKVVLQISALTAVNMYIALVPVKKCPSACLK